MLSRPLENSSSPVPLEEQRAKQAAGNQCSAAYSHSHLNGHHHLPEELSVQHTSNSNSSLGGGSACSLVNNESLGLDERGIFEQFDKRDRCAPLKFSWPPFRCRLGRGTSTQRPC